MEMFPSLTMELLNNSSYEPCCAGQVSWLEAENRLIIDTFANGSSGEYTIEFVFDLKIKVTIADAGSTAIVPSYQIEEQTVQSRAYKVNVQVHPCAVTDMQLFAPGDLPTIYTISTTETLDFSTFELDKECEHPIESYQIEVEGYTIEELGMSIDEAGQLKIDTTDSNLRDKSYSV